jgi:class 3 adenylate cyclase
MTSHVVGSGGAAMSKSQLSLSEWLARCNGMLGLVFTDVVGSTPLLFARKTVAYTRLLRGYRAHARELIESLEGRLIDEPGDELFAAFPSAASAYRFAWEFFHDTGVPDLQIRAGVHYGAVSEERNVLVGRDVHLGARVMQQAEGAELWLSDAAKAALEAESPSSAAQISWIATVELELKGIPHRQRLWRVA